MWRWLTVVFWLAGAPLYGQGASLIYTDNEANAMKTAVLTQADKDVRHFFSDKYGHRVEGPIVLVGTSDPKALNDHLTKGLADLGRRPRTKPINTLKLCSNKTIGAAASRPYIVMCWLKPKAYNAKWIASISRRLPPILAHEFTHQLQYYLAADDPAQRIAGTKEFLLGPSWMIEGSAEVFEQLYKVHAQGDDAGDDAAQTLFNMQSPARRGRLTLSRLSPTDSTKGRDAYGTARFAAYLLARRNGPDALFRYFEVLGKVKDRNVAFSQVFGFTFETFEADFERVRRNFAAATKYALGSTQ